MKANNLQQKVKNNDFKNINKTRKKKGQQIHHFIFVTLNLWSLCLLNNFENCPINGTQYTNQTSKKINCGKFPMIKRTKSILVRYRQLILGNRLCQVYSDQHRRCLQVPSNRSSSQKVGCKNFDCSMFLHTCIKFHIISI